MSKLEKNRMNIRICECVCTNFKLNPFIEYETCKFIIIIIIISTGCIFSLALFVVVIVVIRKIYLFIDFLFKYFYFKQIY